MRQPILAALFVLAAAPTAFAQSVASFTLIDAASDQPIDAFDPIPDGATIPLALAPSLNIRANTSPGTVGSVVFTIMGPVNAAQTENAPPYALFGDNSGNYNPWIPTAGEYALSASAFSGAGGSGTTDGPLMIGFEFTTDPIDENEPPMVNAGGDFSLPATATMTMLAGTASDADGTIDAVLWTQTAGPTAMIADADTLTPTISGLVEAFYAFRLTATDDEGASASDEVLVTVGEPPTSATISGELKQWHRFTLTFPGPFASETDTANPFLDRRMTVTFTQGDLSYAIPGFFAADGNALDTGATEGNAWRVHFAPPTTGEWTYIASFRTGPEIAVDPDPLAGTPGFFDGEQGTITIAETDKAAPDFRALGLLAYDGTHYLRHAGTGDYFVKGGADSPENWLGYTGFDNTFDGGAGPNTPDGLHAFPTHAADWNPGDPDWDRTDPPGTNDGRAIIGALNYLAERGINSIYFLPMNIGGDGKDSWPYVGPINPNGSPANDNLRFDVSKLEQWEVVFAHAQKLGILLHVVLNEAEAPNKLELDDATVGVERRLFYRELAARFGHHNALQWNVSEEYNLSLNIGVAEALRWAEAISEADPYDHPVTVHNAGGLNNPMNNAWSGFVGQDDIDLTSLQWAGRTFGWSDVVEGFRDVTANAGRPIPIMIDEPGSPTRDFDDDFGLFRRQVIWPILLSGGGGEWFINNRDQSLEDFREFETIWDDTSRARRFIEDNLPFWLMEPDDGLVSGTLPSTDGPQAFSLEGEVYAVYLPVGGSGSIDLGPSTDSFSVLWYNPRATQPLAAGTVASIQGPGVVSFGDPPSDPNEDWALLIERVDVVCIPDFTGDDVLDFFDAQLFLDLFSQGNLAADLIGDGTLDFFDVQLFLDLFSQGCP